MVFCISVKNRRRIVGILGIFFLIPITVFADVFAPTSCGALFSTDLITEMTHEIEYRIDGLTSNDSTIKIYTTRGNATDPWVRSATAWTTEGAAPLDLTGASPWNSNSNFTKAGVLISPRHILFAEHFPITNGSTIVFIADDNTIVTRTLQAQGSVVFQPGLPDDAQLGVLDSDVPVSIAFYPIISKNQVEHYFTEPVVPFILFEQEQKALINDIDYLIATYFEHAALVFNSPPATTTRYAFSEGLVGGDSGQPGFFLINNQPTLALTITGDGYGPFYGAYIDAINEEILDLGNDGGYQVSTYDLSCFVGNEDPVVPADTFSIAENTAEGTVVGTVVATDGYGGSEITYDIVSGNTGNAFSINATSGVISVQTIAAIDFETNPTFDLIISATDDWWMPGTATGTIHIDLEDDPEIVIPTVTTVAASSIAQQAVTLNGTISATGGENANERGFILGLTTAYGATTTESGSFSTGAFSTLTTGLTCGTQYHFKAWAQNISAGLGYGTDKSFTTEQCEGADDGGGGGGGGGGGSGGGGSRNSDDETEDETPNVVTSPSLSPALREQILSQLKVLIKELIALGGTPSQGALVFIGAIPATSAPVTTGTFVRDLDVGMSGSDVVRLQQILIAQKKGPWSIQLAGTGATGLFGPLTQSALAEFQVSVRIIPSSGYFGPKTRAVVGGML